MLDNGINRLDKIAQSQPLEGLEAVVWAAIESQSRENRLSRVMVAWQSAVLAIALLSSIGMGARAATSLPTAALGVFSPHASLAPSALFGRH